MWATTCCAFSRTISSDMVSKQNYCEPANHHHLIVVLLFLTINKRFVREDNATWMARPQQYTTIGNEDEVIVIRLVSILANQPKRRRQSQPSCNVIMHSHTNIKSWWNESFFPTYSDRTRSTSIEERRRRRKRMKLDCQWLCL